MIAAENPPAFPCTEKRNISSDPLATPREFQHLGLTTRDWFAGQALAGLLANNTHGSDSAPGYAYFLADKMLIERAKATKP